MTGHPTILHMIVVACGVEIPIILMAWGAWLARCKHDTERSAD